MKYNYILRQGAWCALSFFFLFQLPFFFLGFDMLAFCEKRTFLVSMCLMTHGVVGSYISHQRQNTLKSIGHFSPPKNLFFVVDVCGIIIIWCLTSSHNTSLKFSVCMLILLRCLVGFVTTWEHKAMGILCFHW